MKRSEEPSGVKKNKDFPHSAASGKAAKRAKTTAAERTCSTEFESLTREHIRPLVEINDQINALTSGERKINSTRIVVAGDQSHGKTSLLEALSGADLPRGEGIQTRVPLVLQLREAGTEDEHATIKLESSTEEPERIPLESIGGKVKEYTEVAAGGGKDIRDNPIELKIFRKDQDDLTLVDLPGITRVALSGQAGGDGRKLEEMILGMCRKYMEPEQSILLNVVSAMVDFSTSASLQLSRELDPTGKRTMLCVTKVDQHKEGGLNDKIHAAIEVMELTPERVFAVRNRSQHENDSALTLDEVRHLENIELEALSRDEVIKFGLGVGALSKELVKIQYEQIVKTLPQARAAILRQCQELERKLEKLGKPLGDATACRAKVMHCIETSIGELQNEVLGRAVHAQEEMKGSCEGASLEISLRTENLSDLRKTRGKNEDDVALRESKTIGDFCFELVVYPQGSPGKKEAQATLLQTHPSFGGSLQSQSRPRPDVGVYLKISPPPGIQVELLVVNLSFNAVSGPTFSERMERTHEFSQPIADDKKLSSKQSVLWHISAKDADNISGPVDFCASLFVEKVVIRREGDNNAETMLLCARLNKLQDELVRSVDQLYSNHYFFSGAFRKALAHEVAGCRGGVGLPGAIAPHVPVNVLQKLRQQIPEVVKRYRDHVKLSCLQKVGVIVDRHFSLDLYPKLHELIHDECKCLFEQQASNLTAHHSIILDWEESVCSSNHYFMDTVQEVRKAISGSDLAKPSYLNHLTDAKIKLMSNEEQRLVDMQIEIYAYWKLMKKRLVDYIIMSTHSELVNKPINAELKPTLLEATMSRGDKELVNLLSAEASIARERTVVSARFERLRKAKASLEEYDQNVRLSLYA